ncbi:MAG: response regulator, partial [Desulfobacteraceae bacterium]|nr:response regulator [Desulfobacteraceae bacterium]
DIIHGSASSLLTVINDILDFSKIEAGKLDLEFRKFSLKKVIKEIQSIFQLKAKEKSLEFIVDISDEFPQFLMGDETRIRQILINLVGNAIKFTKQGFVKISARQKNQKRLVLEVEDTGPGIDEGYIDKLFDKFSQADESITRKHGGTGLGLAISKQLIQLMNGTIKVRNKGGTGTVFQVDLNLRQSKKESVPDTLNSRPDQDHLAILKQRIGKANLTILLAEDNPVNQQVMKHILKNLNLTADIAENGRVVLKILKQKSYDLILMDIQMPEMDGIEATKLIRDPKTGIENNKVPIIALTAMAMQQDFQDCINAGMDQYLTKPIHPEKLIQAIAKVVGIHP